MMRLPDLTKDLKENNRKAFIPFFTAFYPSEESFAELLYVAQSSGADILEIGIPFSDPIADGKFVQHSSQWVLERGFKISRFISFLKEMKRDLKIPVVIMSYLNPIYKFGFEKFASFMLENEISGIIFPDLPVEERKILGSSFKSRGISVIGMIAPSTKKERMKLIAENSEGFIYLVSVYGVTGVRNKIDESIKFTASLFKNISDKPLYAGFGISNPEQASELAKDVDGIIVGSAIIKILMGREEGFLVDEVRDFLKKMRGVL
jgi:tryptophan synthase alpha chain